ncbi:hypothetical protein KKH36_01910 [Patescibacteria group bacterium]|nr:hypothetical protein [Patescibacteria group bacterium]
MKEVALINLEKSFLRKFWKEIVYWISKNEIWRETPPEEGFEYKKPEEKALGERNFFFIPEHWRKEFFILKDFMEIKVYFWRNKEPVTLFIPKKEFSSKISLRGTQRKIIVTVTDFAIAEFYKFFQKKHFKIHSDRLFEYDFEKREFVPKQLRKC